MAGYYVINRASNQQYYFVLRAGNHEVILTSQRYQSKGGARTGISSVQVNSPVDARYERLINSAGNPYFVLKASNGEIIGVSESYSSTQARDNGIASVKANGPTEDIRDNA